MESLGATLPPKPEPKQEKEKTPEPAKEDTPAPPEPEEESQEDEPMSEESDVELDMEGVVEVKIHGKNGPPTAQFTYFFYYFTSIFRIHRSSK